MIKITYGESFLLYHPFPPVTAKRARDDIEEVCR